MKKPLSFGRRTLLFLSLALGCILCSCALDGIEVQETSAAYSKYLKGLLSDRFGHLEEAVVYYQKAQELDDAVPALHFQLGLDYIRLKKIAEATREFEKVARLDSKDDQARYILALLYVQLNESKKAADQYEKILQEKQNDRILNIQLRRFLSQLYFLDRDFSSVKKHCEKILELTPFDESALYTLAMVADEEGQTSKAIEGFKDILARNPEQADAINALAYLYAEHAIELEKALALAEKAVEQDSSNAAFLDTLGWVYFKLGGTDKALEFLQRASQLGLDPVILNHLAEAYYKRGMLKEAKESWKSSLVLDPLQPEIRKRLKTF